MKEFKFLIPIDGWVTVPITSDSAEEALQILLDKKESFELHPLGKLNLKIEDALIIESDPKIVS